jgi:hypothetical protein
MQARTFARLGALGSDAVSGTRQEAQLVTVPCGSEMPWSSNSNDQPDVILGR